MIVRLSGSEALAIAGRLCDDFSEAGVQHCRLGIRSMSVPTTVYQFIAPNSYTGEHSIELHLPGNPLLARMVLQKLIEQGARLAEPGEFTARAFFNGRISLEAAEGVAATIAAQNEAELRGARQLMAGELSRQLTPVMDALADTLALIEAGIDFSEEDISFIDSDEATDRIASVMTQLETIVRGSARFEQLSHEPTIVLVGRPNAGKSTLLNALAGCERAVVSDVAGTTRDALSAEIRLRRGIVRMIDVAGVEDNSERASESEIDRLMQARARESVARADVVILVRELGDDRSGISLPRTMDMQVLTKLDLHPGKPLTEPHSIHVSARTGENLDRLRDRLDLLAFGDSAVSSTLVLNARHLRAIDEAQAALRRALADVRQTPELLALDLRDALNALGQILGQITPDDLLGRLFSTFCIGK